MKVTYHTTIDIPGGISKGESFGEDIEAASNYFGDAARGSYPAGTIVTFIEQRGEDFAEETTYTTIDSHTHEKTEPTWEEAKAFAAKRQAAWDAMKEEGWMS